jgi:hypothetical protein
VIRDWDFMIIITAKLITGQAEDFPPQQTAIVSPLVIPGWSTLYSTTGGSKVHEELPNLVYIGVS